MRREPQTVSVNTKFVYFIPTRSVSSGGNEEKLLGAEIERM